MPSTNGHLHNWSLSHDPWGRLVFTDAGGTQHVGVETIRAFPLGDPAHWISIVDATGHELVLIESLDGLADDTRALLREELARREFLPIITRIVQIKGEVPHSRWTVETDRGLVEFNVSEDDHTRKLGPDRLLIIDERGMRYLIADIARLDTPSRRAIEPYV
jgi:hypothetical protein